MIDFAGMTGFLAGTLKVIGVELELEKPDFKYIERLVQNAIDEYDNWCERAGKSERDTTRDDTTK